MKSIEDNVPIIRTFEEIFGLSLKIFIVTATIVIIVGVYVANLIYGDSSLHRLQSLQREKKSLQYEIQTLKEDNAKLHKQYLEWTDAKRLSRI
jgi:cell division protein FtsB